MADWDSGGGKKAPKLTDKKVAKLLRNVVASGDTKTVAKVAERLNLSARDKKGLLFITKQQRPSGFLDKVTADVTGTVTGLPKGLANLGVGAAKEVFYNPVKLGVDVAKGKKVSTDDVLSVAPVVSVPYNVAKGAVTGRADPDNPVTTGIGTSFRRTGERITNPEQALKDYSERPFSTLMEDVGNVAIVGGVAAKVARAAGAPSTAMKLERLARKGYNISNAPFLPVSMTARGANRVLRKIGESRVGRSKLAEITKTTPEARQLKPVLRAGEEAKAEASNVIARSFRTQEKVLPKVAEQEAMYLIGQRQAQTLARASDRLTIEQLMETVDPGISREGVELAISVVKGQNPGLKARIDQALEMGRTGRAKRETGYLSRGDREAQLGYEPLPAQVAGLTAKQAARVEKAMKVATRAREKADANRGRLARTEADAEFVNIPAEQQIGTGNVSHFTGQDVKLAGKLGREQTRQRVLDNVAKSAETRLARERARLTAKTANAQYDVSAAPARLRPALNTNRKVVAALTELENGLRSQGLETKVLAQLADDIPVTLKALEDAGIDAEHFINPSTRAPQGVGQDLTLPRPKARLSESRQRKMQGVHDFTVRAQARAEISRAREVVERQTAEHVAELPFVKKAIKYVKEDGSLPTRAELNAKGLEAWAPTSPFQVAGTISGDTLLMPKVIFDSFKDYFAPKQWERVFEVAYDPLTRAFKTVVLPLSVSWNVGNAVTNALMAMAGGGVGPLRLAREMGRAVAGFKRTGEFSGPSRLFSSGSTRETLDFIGRESLERGGRLRRTITAPARAGYKINEVVDNIYRSALYNAKKAQGYTDEVALRTSLNALGDFTKLSPFEKRVVRRAIPFYTWVRHMAQLSVRLPIEHPLRTAAILHLSNEFRDSEAWEEMLPSFMQGFVGLPGDNVLSVQNMVPFSNPFAITRFGQNLSPQLKLLLGNLPGSPARGINFLSGRPYSRPPGTARQDEFGRDLPTSPSILNQLRDIPPQLRAFDALSGRDDIARYESGDPVLIRGENGKRKTLKTPQSDLTTISRLLGFPVRSESQLREIVDSILARRVDSWKRANPVADTTTSKKGDW